MGRRTKQENQRLKEWAKHLYAKDNLEGKEISRITGVSEQTLVKWKKEGSWEKLRLSYARTKEEQLKDLYDQLNELNESIRDREPGKRFPSSKEADIIKKITAAISDLESELNISTVIDVCIEVTSFIRSYNWEKAQEVNDLFNRYIQSKI